MASLSDARSFTERDKWAQIGEIAYSSSQAARLLVPVDAPTSVTAAYDINIEGQQNFPGMYLTSHRSNAWYTKATTIPASFVQPEQQYNELFREIRRRHQGQQSAKSPFSSMKESLIAAAVYGEGSTSVRADPVASEVWSRFQQVLAHLLPREVGFERLVVDAPEVLVEAKGGSFPIEESSGGMAALMELGWQILLRSFGENDFVVLFDEPENHLHPELQRELLPNLLGAFPSIRFVVATHSPFVVTSVPQSNVYVLDFGHSGRVESRLLDHVNKAAGAEETLERVLGLSSTMPRWVEREYSRILSRYEGDVLTSESVVRLRAELVGLGIASDFPTALSKLLGSSGGREVAEDS